MWVITSELLSTGFGVEIPKWRGTCGQIPMERRMEQQATPGRKLEKSTYKFHFGSKNGNGNSDLRPDVPTDQSTHSAGKILPTSSSAIPNTMPRTPTCAPAEPRCEPWQGTTPTPCPHRQANAPIGPGRHANPPLWL